MNLALLGPGKIASTQLAPAIAVTEEAQLWSVLSRDAERAQAFAAEHAAVAPNPAHTSLDSLLADAELDGVVVATPDKLHAEQAIAAARAGKHVLVEKPMATDLEGAEAMVRACDEAAVRLGVGYHLRWHAGHRKIVDEIRNGRFGELRHVRALWAWPAPDGSNWRARPEVGRWWSLAGVGTHCLDLIRWILVPTCGEVVSLASTISDSVWGGPHDETAVVSLRFESGATAEFCSSVLFEAESRLEVYGTEGRAICTGTLGAHGAGSITTREGPLDFEPANPFEGEIRDFVAAVAEGCPPEVDGHEGLRNVELLLEADARG